jgi:ABC-type multidrug transport system fused ATPase/permease subunit
MPFSTACYATASLVKDPVMLVALLGYLLWQQPKVTLISLLVLPVCVVPIVIYNRKARQSSRAAQEQMAELGGLMAESFSGVRVIKAYNLEPTVLEQFRAAARRYIGHAMRLVRSAETPGRCWNSSGPSVWRSCSSTSRAWAARALTPRIFWPFCSASSRCIAR